MQVHLHQAVVAHQVVAVHHPAVVVHQVVAAQVVAAQQAAAVRNPYQFKQKRAGYQNLEQEELKVVHQVGDCCECRIRESQIFLYPKLL